MGKMDNYLQIYCYKCKQHSPFNHELLQGNYYLCPLCWHELMFLGYGPAEEDQDHTCEPMGNGFCKACGDPCDGHG